MTPNNQALPSTQKLVKASLAALLGAGAIFAIAVLPAEYGIDPLGTGKLLGLMPAAEVANETPEEAKTLADGTVVPVVEGPATHYSETFKFDSEEIVIKPHDFVEYKYYLPVGASLDYSWEVSGPVNVDFHGAPDNYPESPEQSYSKKKITISHGSLVAPFSGLHGWFWENTGDAPVTVKLTAAGFFVYAAEFKSNGQRKRHDVHSASELAGFAVKP
jgi:hypothetical protein